MPTKEEIREKKVELGIEKTCEFLISDLNYILDNLHVDSKNLATMEECYYYLLDAQAFILKAKAYCGKMDRTAFLLAVKNLSQKNSK